MRSFWSLVNLTDLNLTWNLYRCILILLQNELKRYLCVYLVLKRTNTLKFCVYFFVEQNKMIRVFVS